MSVDSLLAGLLSPRSLLTWKHYLNFLMNQNASFQRMHLPEDPAFSLVALLLRQSNKLQAPDLGFLCSGIICCALRFGAGISFLRLLW